MKNKILFFGIIFILLVTFSVIVGFSYNDWKGNAWTKSSPKSGVITNSQDQEEEKGVYVYITKTGKKFHKESCRYLKKSKIKITLNEACKRGYTPCKVCKPSQCPEK